MVLGSHFRLNLIGKPGKQDGMDDKYYQALRYVGVSGTHIDHSRAHLYSALAEATFANAQGLQNTSEVEAIPAALELSLEELKMYLQKFKTDGE